MARRDTDEEDPDAVPDNPYEPQPRARPNHQSELTQGNGTYTIQPGDSWWRIAERVLGSGTRYAELAAANGMSPDTVIHPGQIINIPGATTFASEGPPQFAPMPQPRPGADGGTGPYPTRLAPNIGRGDQAPTDDELGQYIDSTMEAPQQASPSGGGRTPNGNASRGGAPTGNVPLPQPRPSASQGNQPAAETDPTAAQGNGINGMLYGILGGVAGAGAIGYWIYSNARNRGMSHDEARAYADQAVAAIHNPNSHPALNPGNLTAAAAGNYPSEYNIMLPGQSGSLVPQEYNTALDYASRANQYGYDLFDVFPQSNAQDMLFDERTGAWLPPPDPAVNQYGPDIDPMTGAPRQMIEYQPDYVNNIGTGTPDDPFNLPNPIGVPPGTPPPPTSGRGPGGRFAPGNPFRYMPADYYNQMLPGQFPWTPRATTFR